MRNFYEQRQYQQEAIGKCLDAMTAGGKTSVMLESPVGSGKTYMALELIHRFQESLGRKISIGWVAPPTSSPGSDDGGEQGSLQG